jgi:twitching motility protein PilT
MLAGSLRGVVAQLLLKRDDQEGRVAVNEILVSTPAVSSVIREGSTQKLYDIITGGKEYGMQFMDDAIWQKMLAGEVSALEAYMKAIDKSRFRQALPPEYSDLGNSGGSASKD